MDFYDWENEKARLQIDGYSRGVAAGKNLMMAHVKLEAGAITAPHSHDYEEIIYVVSGKWKVAVGDEECVVGADQSLVIPPNVEHSSFAEEDTLALVCTNYRPEWIENSDFLLHYNNENYLWAV